MILFRLFALFVAISAVTAEQSVSTATRRHGFQPTALGCVKQGTPFVQPPGLGDSLRGGAIFGNKDVEEPKKLGLVEHIVLAFRELAQSAAYGFAYALFAVLFAGWVENLFPRYNPKVKYTTVGLLLQVTAQAGMNAFMAQFTRHMVNRLPLLGRIDPRPDKRLPAANGGVVFSFLMFSRQSNWKSKVKHLDSLLDKTEMFA